MKQIFLALPFMVAISGCALLQPTPTAVEPASVTDESPDVSMAETGWDGSLLVCGETLDFAQTASDPLPEFSENTRMGFCARTVKYLALHREHGTQTPYFGIAAQATASYAIMNARFMRRVYARKTWKFVEQLNLSTDKNVNAAAAELTAGAEIDDDFTSQLIAQENADVQQLLDALQSNDPELYIKTLGELAGTYNPTNPMLVQAIESNAFFAAFEAELAAIRAEIETDVDFANFGHRVKIATGLGQMLANIPEPVAQATDEPVTE